MSQRIITRRQVLRGLSGFTLGLPFLPSLLPGRAYGQDAVFAARPRFLAMTTEHGGVFESAMFPDESTLTDTEALYPGHSIRYGALQRSVEGADAAVSTVLRGPAERLSAQLVSKMNVLWGLDIPFYIAHHTGGHLGNNAQNDGNGDDSELVQPYPMPTIDQLMAWSPTFYDDLGGVSLRSIVTGSRNRLSWNWSNPGARSGAIEEVRNTRDALSVFEGLFSTSTSPASQPTRRSIVDRVIENYRSLRDGNRRLSALDRQRLEDHMERLAELQRRADALTQARASCSEPVAPPRAADDPANLALLVDVIANAFICGASRIAVVGVVDERFCDYVGDWHQDVAHKWSDAGAQPWLQQSHGSAFREVFLQLAARLDAVEESPGVSVLDNTLMTWSQESGEMTHEARSIPVVTFGGAAGFLRTGLFCDYRNRTPQGTLKSSGEYSGLLYSQWLATCLQAMRLPQEEWQNVENNASAGYGYLLVDDVYRPTHVSGVVENASEVLPQLRA
jgi:hypothetical protein